MAEFIKGIDLCREFFLEAAKPILDKYDPNLKYSAGLLGYGSDVLGYDDMVSADHMWGPRFYLFLAPEDIGKKAMIEQCLARNLPYMFKGFSVNFSKPDEADHGVRHAELIEEGEVSPLIFIYTWSQFLTEYLGAETLDDLEPTDFLTLSEHRLLAVSCGSWFADELKLQKQTEFIRFYPEVVKYYLLASNWSILSEEQAFMRRCYDVGDDLGSRLVAARIADRIMRLCFLYKEQYAPYSKWFGTAFSRLPVDHNIGAHLTAAICEKNIKERERALVEAQLLAAVLHNESGITESIEVKQQSYFNRNIQVIFADRIVQSLEKRLEGTVLESVPLIGTLSQVGNLIAIADDPAYRRRMEHLYTEPI